MHVRRGRSCRRRTSVSMWLSTELLLSTVDRDEHAERAGDAGGDRHRRAADRDDGTADGAGTRSWRRRSTRSTAVCGYAAATNAPVTPPTTTPAVMAAAQRSDGRSASPVVAAVRRRSRRRAWPEDARQRGGTGGEGDRAVPLPWICCREAHSLPTSHSSVEHRQQPADPAARGRIAVGVGATVEVGLSAATSASDCRVGIRRHDVGFRRVRSGKLAHVSSLLRSMSLARCQGTWRPARRTSVRGRRVRHHHRLPATTRWRRHRGRMDGHGTRRRSRGAL